MFIVKNSPFHRRSSSTLTYGRQFKSRLEQKHVRNGRITDRIPTMKSWRVTVAVIRTGRRVPRVSRKPLANGKSRSLCHARGRRVEAHISRSSRDAVMSIDHPGRRYGGCILVLGTRAVDLKFAYVIGFNLPSVLLEIYQLLWSARKIWKCC